METLLDITDLTPAALELLLATGVEALAAGATPAEALAAAGSAAANHDATGE